MRKRRLPLAGWALSRRRLLTLTATSAAALVAGRLPALAGQGAGVAREVLPSGLTVIAEEQSGADTVAVSFTRRVGARDDGAHPGLNLLTMRMHNVADQDVRAALVGGWFSFQAGKEATAFTTVVPSSDAELAFRLLADTVGRASLSQSFVERQRQFQLQQIAQRSSSPAAVLDELFQRELFGANPLSSSVLGTADSVSALTAADVEAFLQGPWRSAPAVLTVAGRIGTAQAFDLARRSLTLPESAALQRVVQPVVLSPGGGRTVRATVGQQQAQFRLGFPAPGLENQSDRYALSVLDAIMGSFSGRMVSEVRGRRGLAYSAGSLYVTYSDSGTWYAYAGVDPDVLDAGIDAAREEIHRLQEAAPSEQEVSNRINLIAGRSILDSEGNAARVAELAARELFAADSTDRFVERIRQVTPDDVLRVARGYLIPSRSLLAVVAPRPA